MHINSHLDTGGASDGRGQSDEGEAAPLLQSELASSKLGGCGGGTRTRLQGQQLAKLKKDHVVELTKKGLLSLFLFFHVQRRGQDSCGSMLFLLTGYGSRFISLI
jgi:hypothetical protein